MRDSFTTYHLKWESFTCYMKILQTIRARTKTIPKKHESVDNSYSNDFCTVIYRSLIRAKTCELEIKKGVRSKGVASLMYFDLIAACKWGRAAISLVVFSQFFASTGMTVQCLLLKYDAAKNNCFIIVTSNHTQSEKK